FNPRAKQTLGVFEVEHVCDRPQIVFMSFVDGRSVQFRSQLFLRVVPIVHPNLNEVRTVRRQIAHGLTGLLDSCDDVRHIISRRVDRKSTRLNSSHQIISYAVFCLKKKKKEAIRSTEPKYDLARSIVRKLKE